MSSLPRSSPKVIEPRALTRSALDLLLIARAAGGGNKPPDQPRSKGQRHDGDVENKRGVDVLSAMRCFLAGPQLRLADPV